MGKILILLSKLGITLHETIIIVGDFHSKVNDYINLDVNIRLLFFVFHGQVQPSEKI